MSLPRDELARWQDIGHLLRGNASQRRAYALLHRTQILQFLAPYDAVLIGTIPIGLDIPGSDLDIACCAVDLAAVAGQLAGRYGQRAGYDEALTCTEDGPALVVNFRAGEFTVQIFAQAVAVVQQRGYRHMLIEHRLLRLAGAPARDALRSLKTSGLKTEPAFARHFHLAGDPYQVLYAMSFWSDDQLDAWYRERFGYG